MRRQIYLLITLVFIIALSFGCAKSDQMTEESTLSELYGFAYEVVKVKTDDVSGWIPPSGILNVLLTGNKEDSGYLTRVWSDFAEGNCPSGSICKCTAKVVQEFEITDKPKNVAVESPYSIFDSPTLNDLEEEELQKEETVKVYYLRLKLKERISSEFCKAEPDRVVAIYRFKNNNLMIVDGPYQVSLKKRASQ